MVALITLENLTTCCSVSKCGEKHQLSLKIFIYSSSSPAKTKLDRILNKLSGSASIDRRFYEEKLSFRFVASQLFTSAAIIEQFKSCLTTQKHGTSRTLTVAVGFKVIRRKFSLRSCGIIKENAGRVNIFF